MIEAPDAVKHALKARSDLEGSCPSQVAREALAKHLGLSVATSATIGRPAKRKDGPND